MEPRTLTIFLLAAAAVSPALAGQLEFFVSPDGNDANPGTFSRPLRTLTRARDAVRLARADGGRALDSVTVWLRGGSYPLLSTFSLTAEDGGTECAPVVYRSCKGEIVRLVGGLQISGFKPVTDPHVLTRMDPACAGKVLWTDLKAQGITDFGRLTNRGFGRPITPAHLELFFNDRPMTLAEWPNGGWSEIADVPAGPNGGKFTYSGDRPSRWTQADDIWVHGYWTWAWADSYEKVRSIDLSSSEIYTEPPHGCYGYQPHKRWRALNLLEELDTPGEYYLDRNTGFLYFWPPEPVSKGRAVVSMIEEPMIRISGAKHIRLEGLIIEACRGTAVVVEGCENVVLAGCVIRNVGTYAVSIDGGKANGLLSCDIYETGDGGVALGGGDRKTLTPAGNFVENCSIHHFSRWDRTYRPGVMVSGVGNRVAHNLMYSASHSAIILHGNDHIIEFNEIHHVCNETGDAGAFYMGRDWSQRGNVVRFNFFHDLGSYADKYSAHQFSETMAVYLDDFTCGTRVYGNIFYKANRAVLIGGGRDNIIKNNIFVECKPAVHVDARGLADWTKEYWDGTYPILFDRLKEVNATQPPYTERYPELATLLEDEPRVPKGNQIVRNIVVGDKQWLALIGAKPEWIELRDNLTDQDPMFVDAPNLDFRLKSESPALKLGFKQIPVERIGLYDDEYRRSLPKS
ncbi:MAG: right-handed parallel beta-helix repeat-containing protein [Armatimonadota bacterium]|nr:right-handed parallel beta-helix repeat-containing protein [Armatimonadota bacterium]